MKVYMRDVIAILVLVLLFSSKFLGYNGTVDAMIALVIGYYFSKRVFEENGGKK
jgi:hypothetical protein